jgi:hypothetical protein
MKILIYIFALGLILFQTSCREDILEFEKAEKGRIFVSSEPPNARIYLNNSSTNKYTPDSLYNLKKGFYKITLIRGGYRDTSFTVNLENKLRREYHIRLTARF